jgi:hypothetical protein
MRNKVSKALRRKAYSNVAGKSNIRTEYKRLKRVYKKLRGEI